MYFEHIETGEYQWENPSDTANEFAWQLNHCTTLENGKVYRGWTVTHEPERKWISQELADKLGRTRWSETFAQQPLPFEQEAKYVPEENCAVYYFPGGTPESEWHDPGQSVTWPNAL